MMTAAVEAYESLTFLPTATAPTRKLQECILLIEDSEDAMLLVRYALQEFGHGAYRLVWSSNLLDGFKRLKKDRVDVILLDLGLPERSGLASYAMVHEAAPEVPIVVLTGDASEETEVAIRAGGAQDYLVKDEISGSLLLQAIRSAIYSHGRKQQEKNTRRQRFRWISNIIFNLK